MNNLFNNLMEACEKTNSISFKDVIVDNIKYRIFCYHIATYSDFCLPDALEARGIMFEIKNDIPVRIACRPMEKFFNSNENPFTMNLDYSLQNLDVVMNKEDGSLISTYLHNDKLLLKTKNSLDSEQALNAMNLLNSTSFNELKNEILSLVLNGYTVNMEYVSPNNRIVLPYENDNLIILNVRHNYTGEYISYNHLRSKFKYIPYNLVKVYHLNDGLLDDLSNIENMEGVVIKFINGLHVKIKTQWYCNRHECKEIVQSPRKLFELIVDEQIDDIIPLFVGDDITLSIINNMQNRVHDIYSSIADTVFTFYDANKNLTSRKEYAIKAQNQLNKECFNLVMQLFSNKQIDIKQSMKKNFEEYHL